MDADAQAKVEKRGIVGFFRRLTRKKSGTKKRTSAFSSFLRRRTKSAADSKDNACDVSDAPTAPRTRAASSPSALAHLAARSAFSDNESDGEAMLDTDAAESFDLRSFRSETSSCVHVEAAMLTAHFHESLGSSPAPRRRRGPHSADHSVPPSVHDVEDGPGVVHATHTPTCPDAGHWPCSVAAPAPAPAAPSDEAAAKEADAKASEEAAAKEVAAAACDGSLLARADDASLANDSKPDPNLGPARHALTVAIQDNHGQARSEFVLVQSGFGQPAPPSASSNSADSQGSWVMLDDDF